MTNLARMLDIYLRVYNIDQGKLADELGMSASTVTRLKAGKMPDAAGFARLIMWLASEAKPVK